MPTYNYKAKELIAKIVYYGPGRCGKTTNLQQVHAKMRPETRSELLSVATETDRTIYFDLLPLNLGTINGMKFLVRLFTVPGQVYYAETRKLVLRGTDGLVFVADSQDHMLDENRESLRDLKTNLRANNLDYANLPMVLQYNKRDLPRVTSEAELDAALNDRGVKAIGSVASMGTGVLETLRYITVAVFNQVKATSQSAMPKHIRARAATDVGPLSQPSGATPSAPDASPTKSVRALADAHTKALPSLPANFGMKPSSSESGAMPVPQVIATAPLVSPATTSRSPSSYWARTSVEPRGDRPPPPPPLGADMLFDEFRSLAVMHSQLAERLALVEQEVKRLGRENQDIRERMTRQFE